MHQNKRIIMWLNDQYGEGNENVKVVIEALEKQIAKKILYRKQNYGTPYLCCECEADQTPTEFFCEDGSEPKEKHTFCWKCGQKLDWSDRA